MKLWAEKNSEKAKEIKKEMVDYVDAVEKYLTGDLEIFIGSENPFFENTEYSMMSTRINNSIIAVIGPMRMNYRINLSLLERI